MRAYRYTLLLTLAFANIATADESNEPFRVALNKHCVVCHGPETQEGEVRLDNLPLSDLSAEQIETWKTAFERVASGEMPPDEAEPLPAETIKSFRQHLQPIILREAARLAPKQVVLRRLNKEQYRNSLRDLLGIDVTVEDPAAGLPPDEVAGGFDNVGAALTMSPLHVKAYFEAAEMAVAQWEAQAQAVPNSFRFQVPSAPDAKKPIRLNFAIPGDGYFEVFNSGWTNRRFKTVVFPAEKQTHTLWPAPGRYRITVDVEAINTDNVAGYEMLQQLKLDHLPDPRHTPQFGFYLRRPDRAITPNIDQRVAAFEIPHGQRKTMSAEAFLPGGMYTLAINFDTGPRFDLPIGAAQLYYERDGVSARPNKKDYADREAYDIAIAKYTEQEKARDKLIKAFRKVREPDQQKPIHDYLSASPVPRLRFHSVVIEGPLPDPSMPSSELFEQVDQDEKRLHDSLRRFASRAFRRPITNEELAPYIEYAKENGYRSAMKAVLCSPNFLYLSENPGELEPFALASRLSYFLWNSTPDLPLLRRAMSGELAKPEILTAEVDRMLADEKANSFVSRFVYQWLGLENMAEMPAAKTYVYYHDLFVSELMVEESNLFFRDMIERNAPVADIFHADYTFMNSALARHYGRSDVLGGKFERVSLTNDPRRRGLLGQGAVLTTSANGVDTSPVVRGIWVLDKLFGTPPSPPPEDVEVIEPDTRGTTTLREMYAAHRTDASCNRCHQKIDPLGFALENFDPIGRWRDAYESGVQVEAYGKLPDGQNFDDIQGLRALLDEDKVDLLAKNLATRLLICATGRTLSVADDAHLDRLLAQQKETGYRFRDLIQAVVSSNAFLNK